MSKSRLNRRNRLAYYQAGHEITAKLLHETDDLCPHARLEARVMRAQAGAVAEGIYAQCAPSEGKTRPLDDAPVETVETLLADMESEEARRYAAWLERRTWNLLKRHWTAVDAEAKAHTAPTP